MQSMPLGPPLSRAVEMTTTKAAAALEVAAAAAVVLVVIMVIVVIVVVAAMEEAWEWEGAEGWRGQVEGRRVGVLP